MAGSRSTRAKREITFSAPRDLIEAVEEKIARTGTSMDTVLRLALRSYLGRPDVYHLDTVLTFGRYNGEIFEDVLRADTRYVLWCLVNLPAFALSKEANDLLNELLPDTGMAVRKYQRDGDYEDVIFVPDEVKTLDVPAHTPTVGP